jgi:putative tricarboxylic transport membrane protein
VKVRSLKNLLSGLIFLAFAVVFLMGAVHMPIGAASQMGAGYFPLVLSVILGLLGLTIVGSAFSIEDGPPSAIQWRGLFFIVGSVVVFALTLKGLGLVPALALTILITRLGAPRFSPAVSLALAAGLVGFVWIVFVLLLKLPWQPFGPWLVGY